MSPSLLWPDPFSSCHQDHLKIGYKSYSLTPSASNPPAPYSAQVRHQGPGCGYKAGPEVRLLPRLHFLSLSVPATRGQPAAAWVLQPSLPCVLTSLHLVNSIHSSALTSSTAFRGRRSRPQASVLHSQGATVSASCGCGD